MPTRDETLGIVASVLLASSAASGALGVFHHARATAILERSLQEDTASATRRERARRIARRAIESTERRGLVASAAPLAAGLAMCAALAISRRRRGARWIVVSSSAYRGVTRLRSIETKPISRRMLAGATLACGIASTNAALAFRPLPGPEWEDSDPRWDAAIADELLEHGDEEQACSSFEDAFFGDRGVRAAQLSPFRMRIVANRCVMRLIAKDAWSEASRSVAIRFVDRSTVQFIVQRLKKQAADGREQQACDGVVQLLRFAQPAICADRETGWDAAQDIARTCLECCIGSGPCRWNDSFHLFADGLDKYCAESPPSVDGPFRWCL